MCFLWNVRRRGPDCTLTTLLSFSGYRPCSCESRPWCEAEWPRKMAACFALDTTALQTGQQLN